MLGWRLMGSTGFEVSIGDELCSASGGRDVMCLCAWGFRWPTHIWRLPGREVSRVIGDFPGTLSTVSIGSPNVLGTDEAALCSVCGWMTPGTINSVILHFVSLSRMQSAASPQPGCVNSSSFICFCLKCSIRCCTILEIMPISQPGLSSSCSLRSARSSSSSTSSWQSAASSELLRLLRLSPMACNISSNIVSGFVVVKPALSAFLISSCCCWIAVSPSSTNVLATAVSLSK